MSNEQTQTHEACAYDNCKNIVTDEDFCHGCKRYVCETHSPFMTWGGHDVSAHWDQEDDDDDAA